MSLPLLNKLFAVILIFLFASGQNEAFAAPKKKVGKFPTRLMAIQMPTAEVLMKSFRFSNNESHALLLKIKKQAAVKLATIGFNANVTTDKAVDDGLPILSIYPTKVKGINLLSKGYALEAAVTQYGRKVEGGPLVATYYQRIGTSPVVCFTGDFEQYSLMLVDVYIQIHMSAKEFTNKKAAVKGGK